MRDYKCILIFCWVLLSIGSCKKNSTKNTTLTPTILRDTTITLQNANTIPVRISFTEGTYMDFTFISNINEGRCPTCVNGQHDTCYHAGIADAYFQVSDEAGRSTEFSVIFKSCQLQKDTSENYRFIPFHDHYTVYPIRLDPYPIDNGPATSPYTLTLYIKQN